jgi:hypothetical protein
MQHIAPPFCTPTNGASNGQSKPEKNQRASAERKPEKVEPEKERPKEANGAKSKPAPKDRPKSSAGSANQTILIGRRLMGSTVGSPVSIPIELLKKHTVVLAGAGSGKSVLLKRLIEEAALEGIPSIVADCANDMAALGDPWPEHESDRSPEDRLKAASYFGKVDVIVWTPQVEGGNPLRLDPLPDFETMADEPDVLKAAIMETAEGLQDLLSLGKSKSDQLKFGLLCRVIKNFAEQRLHSLQELIDLLRELPPEAGLGIANVGKIARDLGDALASKMESVPILSSTGMPMDPAVLFGDDHSPRRARVSVINFTGLSGLQAQQQLLNQLANTLFTWIKKHPTPDDRPLRGLLVIDEAKDFLPGQSSTACKGALMRVVAQARKYGLGVVLATQNPREMENTIIGNCSTHFYGKASSPAAIQTIEGEIRNRGGSATDVGTLQTGTFYVYNADTELKAPVKVRTPLCLSRHAGPLTREEVLERARKSREVVQRLATVIRP